MKKLIFFSIIFIYLFAAASANAAGCGMDCYEAYSDFNKTIEPCTSIGGWVGTTPLTALGTAVAQCSETISCDTSHQQAICCCTAAGNMITPGGGASIDNTPKFKIPELQVDLGVKFTQPNCTQGENGQYICEVNWLGEYLTWIYNYALKIIGILAAVMLMAGGLLWLISGGDAGKIGQAKEIIIGSITGLIILMSSYLILVQVNPNLVKMNPISIGNLDRDSIPAPEDTVAFKGKCKATDTGACAIANMKIFGNRAEQASAICMAESGGDPKVSNKTTFCTNGGFAVWGLFQFNLSANKFTDENGVTLNCPSAYNKTWTNSSPSCTIVNQPLYDACVKAATTAELSIKNAYSLAKNGWGPWEANSKWCGF
jgi:hypothetical protein